MCFGSICEFLYNKYVVGKAEMNNNLSYSTLYSTGKRNVDKFSGWPKPFFVQKGEKNEEERETHWKRKEWDNAENPKQGEGWKRNEKQIGHP